MPEPSEDFTDQLDELASARDTLKAAFGSLRAVISSHEMKLQELQDQLNTAELAPLTDSEIEARVDKVMDELRWRHKGTLPSYPLIQHGEELPDGGYGAKSRPEAMAARSFFDASNLPYLLLRLFAPQLRAMLIAHAKEEAVKRGVPVMTANDRAARIAELEPQIAQHQAELETLKAEVSAFNSSRLVS
jgi:uncharacterized small protein (DUF1192 family)